MSSFTLSKELTSNNKEGKIQVWLKVKFSQNNTSPVIKSIVLIAEILVFKGFKELSAGYKRRAVSSQIMALMIATCLQAVWIDHMTDEIAALHILLNTKR